MEFREIAIASVISKNRFRTDLGDIPALAEEIKTAKRLIQPISVNQRMELLAGERRLRACEHLGWTEIPAIVHEVTTKLNALEIELIENTGRKDMTWQERAKLEKRIFEVREDTDDTWSQRKQAELTSQAHGTVNRRLQLAEAMVLLPELGEYENEDDAWKELKKLEEEIVVQHMQKSTPKQVTDASQWADDNYRVGDAFEGMANCRDNLVDFAEIDPPYGVEIDRRKGRNKDSERISEYNEIDADEYISFYRKVATEVHRILKANSFAVFWFGQTWWSETRDVLRDVGFTLPDIAAVWSKGPVGQTASPDTTLGSCYETFWLARKGKPKLATPGHDNVFTFNKLPPSKKIHATEKPIELLDEVIRTILFPGSIIMCPFLGSGVTLRAAYKSGHTGFGWDLSPRNKELFMRKVRGEVIVGDITDAP